MPMRRRSCARFDGRDAADVLVKQMDMPACGVPRHEEKAQQRRLAGTRRPGEEVERARTQMEVHFRQNVRPLLVGERDVRQTNHRFQPAGCSMRRAGSQGHGIRGNRRSIGYECGGFVCRGPCIRAKHVMAGLPRGCNVLLSSPSTRSKRFGTVVMNDTTTTVDPELEVIFTPEAIAGRLNELAREIAGARARESARRRHPEGQLRVRRRSHPRAAQRGAGAGGRFHDAVQLQEGAHLVRSGLDPARHGPRRARPQRPHRR